MIQRGGSPALSLSTGNPPLRHAAGFLEVILATQRDAVQEEIRLVERECGAIGSAADGGGIRLGFTTVSI